MMTNDELNRYIKHYIEKDRTGRAIMLTGAWGVGKSYYIKNSLVPFLACPENGEHKCIVVSLYGLSNLSEVSKAIYLEARAKMLNPESEAGKATLLVAKTVLKGLANRFGIDLNANEKDLQGLYQSIDLSEKLIVFEDVERTDISILTLLGYVNSLVEQDGVKVLLVTNEDEILKNKPAEIVRPEENATSSFAGLPHPEVAPQSKEFTDDSLRYLEIKEKSIGDTIRYVGDLTGAVKEIIRSFDSEVLQSFATDTCASDIVDIMLLLKSENLRSVIFACQKAADIYESIPDANQLSDDFLRTILYGTVFFSLRLQAGKVIAWNEKGELSFDLGSTQYPLFRFCYNYIVFQHFDKGKVFAAKEALEDLRLYDNNKSNMDHDLQILYSWYVQEERTIRESIDSILHRLHNHDEFAFQEYGKIAYYLIKMEHFLGIDISSAKESMVRNLYNKGDKIRAEYLFRVIILDSEEQEIVEEFNELKNRMTESLNTKEEAIFGFTYTPEDIERLYSEVCSKNGFILTDGAFASRIDNEKAIEMLKHSSSRQIMDFRGAYIAVYKPGNIRDFLHGDRGAVEDLMNKLRALIEYEEYDKIQKLQIGYFADNLSEILTRL